MAFRHLLIEHPVRLSVKLNNLMIHVNNDTYQVPIEDIETLVIDNLQSTITTDALAQLSKQKVAVINCDRHHLPCSVNLPLNCYFHRLPVITKQFKLPSKIRKRLWQRIIKQKIANEIKALRLIGRTKLRDLQIIYKNVLPGDPKHCEAIAAKIYFHKMFGDDFVRRNGSTVNGALNYGYSLIRSLIARDICGFGLEPSLGLFHHNQLNSFNLADDLIEPFRSLVDVYVYQIMNHYGDDLTAQDRQDLIKILFLNMRVRNRLQSTTNAIHMEVSSYNQCCLNRSSRLVTPELVKIKEHD